ncbi:MAG: glycosyltransferase [Candidatus Methylomirabilis oxyfera]|nr:glycosyltransferase [Candidatus Methylomirabilis oxyfera]
MTFILWMAGTFYLIGLCLLFLYGINSALLAFLYLRHKAAALLRDRELAARFWENGHRAQLPRVTVQLPIYNERYVVERLIDAAARLDYPRHLLEIQVLDDSTDETSSLAAAKVEQHRAAGIDIVHLHRSDRDGFKGGALREGLKRAKGELIAIFDADFVPPPSFISATLPFFPQDDRLCTVQGRWGHINQGYSPLTAAQAIGIDGHFGIEQPARAWSGLFMNFNGTAGIWRKAAIIEAGGWQTDTLTEDLDLSYRAQLAGWRMKFLPHLVCPAEIPAQLSGFRSQQHRWAKGSIQTAKKLLPRIFRSPASAFAKYQAFLHMTHFFVHPLMIMVILATPPLLRWNWLLPGWRHLWAPLTFLSLAAVGPSTLYWYSQRELYQNWRQRLRAMPFLMLLGTGIAVNNTKAVFEGLFGRRHHFVRTPKYRIESQADGWVGKGYRLPLPWTVLVEVGLFLYSGYGLFLALERGTYLIVPFIILYTMGMGYVAFLGLWQAFREAPHSYSGFNLGKKSIVGAAPVTSTGSVRSLSQVEACPEPSRRARAELSRSGLALPEDGAASGAATNPQCETGNAHSKRWRA